ncbi:MAG TPA: hypothetical protein VIJ71_07415 [Mycobacteriales bacterium]
MKDDELGDHLWSTLEPVSSPTPELARLRRIARRRRRRLQGTAAALGLLLLAGAGVGIAEATNSNSGGAVVTARSPSPADLTIPCRTAEVSLQVGHTVDVAPCPDVSGHIVGAVPAAGTALSQTGRSTFHADQRGTAVLQIEYVGCAGPPLTPCLSDQRLIGTITITVGPKYLKGAPPEQVPCKGGSVTVLIGQEFDLTKCPVGLQSKVDDPSVLAPGSVASEFTAKKAGTTNVELFVKPQCSPGMLCPQYVRDLGTLIVTVTQAG